MSAVVAALKFQNEISTRVTTRQSQSMHRAFRAGIRQPHHLDTRAHIDDSFGDLHLVPLGSGETETMIDCLFDPAVDEWISVSQDDRTISEPVVDVPFSVKIIDVAITSVGYDEGLIISRITKIGVDAIRYYLKRPFKEFMRFRSMLWHREPLFVSNRVCVTKNE
jgi:hypothetical protein